MRNVLNDVITLDCLGSVRPGNYKLRTMRITIDIKSLPDIPIYYRLDTISDKLRTFVHLGRASGLEIGVYIRRIRSRNVVDQHVVGEKTIGIC